MKNVDEYYSQSRPDVLAYVPENIKTILDIGCGEAYFLSSVKKKTNAETWGIEVVPEVAKIAKKNADKVLSGDIDHLIEHLPNQYFDCITFNDVLEHLVEPQNVLESILPKLTETGIVIASIPSVRELSTLFDLMVRKDWRYREYGVLDSTHIRFFTPKSMRRMFEEIGFDIFKLEGLNGNYTWKFYLFNILSLGFFKDTKYSQYICIAKGK
jgi:2-polyprenyl-3-methyl-5-hydroxy-6-metoxy-1,4-benzoquinol methylase